MNAVVTKYHAVRNRLLDKLESMGPGAQLPSERDLSREFGVSRMTIRRATEELVATGVVQRKKGAGVFAAGPKVHTPLASTTFSENMRARGLRPGTLVLSFDHRPAGPRIGRRLEISPNAQVVVAVRLRLADDEPMSIEEIYLPAALVPGIAREDLEDSCYDYLRLQHGVEFAGGVQTIEPTVTDQEESRELGVPLHSPALLVERTTRDGNGRVVEFDRSVFRGDRYLIRNELAVPQHPPYLTGASR